MNFLPRSYDATNNNVFLSFNQDCTSLAVSTYEGYKILSLNTIDSPVEICESETEDICIIERLFSSSLIAMVSLNSPRKLKVVHFKKGTEICQYSYANTILAVKLNRSRLAVCLEDEIFIHNIRDMAVLHTIRDLSPNPRGLLALSTDSDNCYLAYPGTPGSGDIQLFDTVSLKMMLMVPAHCSPLAAMVFSPTGNLIASASERGTVIRVFNTVTAVKLYEFRRGVKRCVNIFSLAFSPDSSLLAATSNTETVHVFRLVDPKDVTGQVAEDQSWMGYLTKAVTSSATYLPTVFSLDRAFASAFLPRYGHRNICAITENHKMLRLLIASSDGYLYIYNLDKTEGGDCHLVKQFRLLKRAEPPPGVPQPLSDGSSNDGPDGADSEKMNEIDAATRRTDEGGFRLDDDGEFPPVNLRSDNA